VSSQIPESNKAESSAALGLPTEGETDAAGKGNEGKEGTNR
jgi:hypothetical protein